MFGASLKFRLNRFYSFLKEEILTKRFIVISLCWGLLSYCLSRENNFDHILLLLSGGIFFLLILIEPYIFDDLKKKHIDILPSNDRRRSDREYDLSKTRLIISFTFMSMFLSLVFFLHVLYTDSKKNLDYKSLEKDKAHASEEKLSGKEKDNNESSRYR